MPSCLGGVRVGAGHEDAPVADPPAGAPHLLAVDDEAVAVALGPRGQRCRGRCRRPARRTAGTTRGRRRSVGRRCCGLLLGRAEAQDRAAGEHEPDHVEHRRHAGRRRTRAATPPGARASGPGRRARPASGCRRTRRRRSSRCQATPGVDQLGRADRAVVGRGLGAVVGQPVRGPGGELLDGDHGRSIDRHDACHRAPARDGGQSGPCGTVSAVTAGARPVRAPRGTELTCRGWPQEAAFRMLQNNLDPEVAERPDDLVVYGGTGRAARSWEAFDAMLPHADARSPTTRRCSCSRASRSASSAPTSGRRGC